MWQNPIQLSLRTFTDSLNDSPYYTPSLWRHHIRPPTLSIHSDSPRVGYTYLRSYLRVFVLCVLLTYFPAISVVFLLPRFEPPLPASHTVRTSVLLNSVMQSTIRLSIRLSIRLKSAYCPSIVLAVTFRLYGQPSFTLPEVSSVRICTTTNTCLPITVTTEYSSFIPSSIQSDFPVPYVRRISHADTIISITPLPCVTTVEQGLWEDDNQRRW
jgi:hypothetical protein